MAKFDANQLLPLILSVIQSQETQQRGFEESRASQQRQFTETRAASERDQGEAIERLIVAAGLRAPKDAKDPNVDVVSQITDIIKRATKTRKGFITEHPDLVSLAGKKDLSKSQLSELKDLRRQSSAQLGPNIDELRLMEVLLLQLGLDPQADLARNAAQQLSLADPVSPISGLFGRTADAARAKAGRGAPTGPGAGPGPEAPGTFSFTGGPGGSAGNFAGTPEDILGALKQFLGTAPGAIERTGPSPGPASAQARAPVVAPATASKGPAVGRLFPEGQSTLFDPEIQRILASLFDPEDRAAGLGIEGLPGF